MSPKTPPEKDYAAKRGFDRTPEPPSEVEGNVDPTRAPPGEYFVIHKHYARRLHYDLRLEMSAGGTPVLVSWAVPNGLPLTKGVRRLAIHVEDHPFEYGNFAGSIPQGEYGAGEVRIFDSGTYATLEQEERKLTLQLKGRRLQASYHLIQTRPSERGQDQWLAMLREDQRPPPDDRPRLDPVKPKPAGALADDQGWAYEPKWEGTRTFAFCGDATELTTGTRAVTADYPELRDLHTRLVAINAMIDGVIITLEEGKPSTFVATDLVYLDGRSLTSHSFEERRQLLEDTLVPSKSVQITPSFRGDGVAVGEAVLGQGFKGVIAKKLDSTYDPRAAGWLQIT